LTINFNQNKNNLFEIFRRTKFTDAVMHNNHNWWKVVQVKFISYDVSVVVDDLLYYRSEKVTKMSRIIFMTPNDVIR